MIMAVLLLAALLQTPRAATPPAPSQSQAGQEAVQPNAQAAVGGMVQIFPAVGSCEHHLSPARIQSVRRPLEPNAGQP